MVSKIFIRVISNDIYKYILINLMKQSTQKCQIVNHNFSEIEYVCQYSKCEQSRYLCSKCALETTHLHDKVTNQHIIKREDYDDKLQQNIQSAQYRIKFIPNACNKYIITAGISNNLKYVVSSGSESPKILQVWDYVNYSRIKSIKFSCVIDTYQFTEDSKMLYVGTYQKLYELQVYKKFMIIGVKLIYLDIQNICCMSNTIIFASSARGLIIRTSLIKKKLLLKIQAHVDDKIQGLDYNRSQNIIASGSEDLSIKLWSGNNGSLLMEKQNAHSFAIIKLLFIIDQNQLISLDARNYIIVWDLNYQKAQIQFHKLIKENVVDISFVLDQQYLLVLNQAQYLSVYNNKLEVIRKLYLGDFNQVGNVRIKQPQSMRAALFAANINSKAQLIICKIKL